MGIDATIYVMHDCGNTWFQMAELEVPRPVASFVIRYSADVCEFPDVVIPEGTKVSFGGHDYIVGDKHLDIWRESHRYTTAGVIRKALRAGMAEHGDSVDFRTVAAHAYLMELPEDIPVIYHWC